MIAEKLITGSWRRPHVPGAGMLHRQEIQLPGRQGFEIRVEREGEEVDYLFTMSIDELERLTFLYRDCFAFSSFYDAGRAMSEHDERSNVRHDRCRASYYL